MRARGLSPKRFWSCLKERKKIIRDLQEVAEQSYISSEDAERLFRERAEVNHTLADAFRNAGLFGENPRDTAERLEKEIPVYQRAVKL